MAFVSCANNMLPTRSTLIVIGQNFHKNERGDFFIRLFLSSSYQGAAISNSRGDKFEREPTTKKSGASTAYQSRRSQTAAPWFATARLRSEGRNFDGLLGLSDIDDERSAGENINQFISDLLLRFQ